MQVTSSPYIPPPQLDSAIRSVHDVSNPMTSNERIQQTGADELKRPFNENASTIDKTIALGHLNHWLPGAKLDARV